MKLTIRVFLFISFVSLTYFEAKSQTDSVTARKIILSFKKLDVHSSNNEADYKKLNNETRIQLLNYLNVHKLSSKFIHELKMEKVTVSRSVDERITILSWSTNKEDYTGLYTSIIQYTNGNIISAKLLFDATNSTTDNPGQRYTQIYILKDKTLGVLYLAKYDETYSNTGSGQGIKAFRVYENQINNVKIFKNGKILVNDLNIGYNTFEYSNIGSPKIRYDTLSNTLFVPKLSLSGAIKKGYDRYRLKGEVFMKL